MMSRDIKIENIIIGNNKRKVNDKLVDSLAESISTIGLLHPIYIDSMNNLISGQHRLLACIALGEETISAVTADVKADEHGALLIELEENTIRDDMSQFDKLALLDRIREVEDNRKNNKNNQYTKVEVGSKVPTSKTRKEIEETRLERDNKKAISAGFKSSAEAKRVRTVSNRGTESLKKAVEDNLIKPAPAVVISKLPKDKQDEAVENVLSGKKVKDIDGVSDGRRDKKIRIKKDNHGSYVEVKIYKSNVEKSANNISSVFGESFRENYIALLSEMILESRKHELKLKENLYKTFSYGFVSMSDGEVIEVKELLANGMKKMDIIDMYGANSEVIGKIDKLEPKE